MFGNNWLNIKGKEKIILIQWEEEFYSMAGPFFIRQ